MFSSLRHSQAINPQYVEYHKQQQDPQIESIPQTQNVERETCLCKSHNFIQHEPKRPEPKDNLRLGNGDWSRNQNG